MNDADFIKHCRQLDIPVETVLLLCTIARTTGQGREIVLQCYLDAKETFATAIYGVKRS